MGTYYLYHKDEGRVVDEIGAVETDFRPNVGEPLTYSEVDGTKTSYIVTEVENTVVEEGAGSLKGRVLVGVRSKQIEDI